jgi:hypothetical protein
MDIKTKEELEEFVSKNSFTADNTEINRFCRTLQQKIYDFYLSRGEIFPSSFVKLFNLCRNADITPDARYENHINFLKKHYSSASIEEKLIINNIIFVLEFLNGSKNALTRYVEKFLCLDVTKILNNRDYLVFENFIETFQHEKSLIKALKNILNNYFNIDENDRKYLFVNIMIFVWNNKKMLNNKIWLKLFDDLTFIIQECIEKNLIEEQMKAHFFTYHIYGNNIQTVDEWKKFNEKIEIPASKFYKKWGTEHNLPKCKKKPAEKKKKIGFLIDRIVFNSPWMVTYSLFKQLLSNKEFNKNNKIYVYSLNYIDKQFDREDLIAKLRELGIIFYSPYQETKHEFVYYSHLNKALLIRNKILEDKIDYLISGFGYDIPNFIFSNRSAPRQIFWSHGNCTSEIENIDVRISHFKQECDEYDWKIFNIPTAEEFLLGNENHKKEAENLKKSLLEKYGENTVFLGTIGRYIKIDSDEYLQIIAEIMKQNPNTVYLACGDGNVESIKEKLKKYGIDENRFVFTGTINPHVYGWIIDIWINTHPLPQGQSQEEFHAKGNGVVVNTSAYYLKQKPVKNFYDLLKKEFIDKNKKEVALEIFNIKEIPENINYIDTVTNLFKQYNVSEKETEELLSCFRELSKINDPKKKWLKKIELTINKKAFFKFNKIMSYRNFYAHKKFNQKNTEQFLKSITQ